MGLQDQKIKQLTLFDTVTQEKTLEIMVALDSANQRFGRGTLRLASQGVRPAG